MYKRQGLFFLLIFANAKNRKISFRRLEPTFYDSYKDKGLLTQPLIRWMFDHNDFSAENYRYTEIVGGHQRCVGSNENDESPNYIISDIRKY